MCSSGIADMRPVARFIGVPAAQHWTYCWILHAPTLYDEAPFLRYGRHPGTQGRKWLQSVNLTPPHNNIALCVPEPGQLG